MAEYLNIDQRSIPEEYERGVNAFTGQVYPVCFVTTIMYPADYLLGRSKRKEDYLGADKSRKARTYKEND